LGVKQIASRVSASPLTEESHVWCFQLILQAANGNAAGQGDGTARFNSPQRAAHLRRYQRAAEVAARVTGSAKIKSSYDPMNLFCMNQNLEPAA
jgi:hypothetical protein